MMAKDQMIVEATARSNSYVAPDEFPHVDRARTPLAPRPVGSPGRGNGQAAQIPHVAPIAVARPTPLGSEASAGGAATVTIRSDADIVTARQQGRALASQLGFAPTEATLVATAISELARNIILYAGRGSIVLRAVDDGGHRGIAIVARDRGPGISDIERAMTGGYSTSGGLGLGLCGVRRLVDEFDIVSESGRGTTVTATKWTG